MFRWYEYWLKGIDNGIMNESAVQVFVEVSREIVTGEQWPPCEVEYRSLHLRPRHKLAAEPELPGPEHATPDGFYQGPLTVTDTVQVVRWSPAPFGADTELIGTGAAHLWVEIDQPDTNLMVTTGFLKASHRQLDEQTTGGDPHHPHTRSVPVEPGVIDKYVLRLYPFRDDVPTGPSAGRGTVRRRASGRRPQRAPAARRVPPTRRPRGDPQNLPGRPAPVPLGSAVRSPVSSGRPPHRCADPITRPTRSQ